MLQLHTNWEQQGWVWQLPFGRQGVCFHRNGRGILGMFGGRSFGISGWGAKKGLEAPIPLGGASLLVWGHGREEGPAREVGGVVGWC